MILWIALGAAAGWLAARHLAVGGLGICLSTATLLLLFLFLVLTRIDTGVVVSCLLFAGSVQVAYFFSHLFGDARAEIRSAARGRLGAA
jgi:hypothetical protein